MPSDWVLIVIQLVFLVLLGFFGWLGLRPKYLYKQWPHALMWTFMVLNLVIMFIIILT